MSGAGDLGDFLIARWGEQDRRPERPPDDVSTRYNVFPEFPSSSKRAKQLSPFHTSSNNNADADLTISGAPTPLHDEDVLTEILCRLPPHEPSSFLRASLVCKFWGRLITTSAAFHRRLRAHHSRAAVLGVFLKYARTLEFIPTLDAPDRIPKERFSLKVCTDNTLVPVDDWAVLACRQGRVLVVNRTRRELLVFSPVSGDRRVVDFPPDFVEHSFTTRGAVVCEDNKLGLQSSKFWIVLVGLCRNGNGNGGETDVAARVYSSETGTWGDLVSAPEPCCVGCLPSTLVGDGLYWWLAEPLGSILHFHLGTQNLTIIDKPPVPDINIGCSRIIRTDDGGVGLAVLSYPILRLYDRKQVASPSHGGAVTWAKRKVVEMDKILVGLPASVDAHRTYITGYSEEAAAIVLSVRYGDMNHVCMVQLDSMRYKELGASLIENSYHPFPIFYTGGELVTGSPALQLPTLFLDNDDGAATAGEDVDVVYQSWLDWIT